MTDLKLRCKAKNNLDIQKTYVLEFKSKDFSEDDEEDGKNVVVAAVD